MKRKIVEQGTFADALTVHNPKSGFLEQVDRLIDWRPVEKALKKRYKRVEDATGKACYPPLMMFKAMLLARWYGLSDPALETALYDRLSFMKFTGLSLASAKPDETTLCRFRNALIKDDLDKKLLALVNAQFEKAGLLVKSGAIVDATVVESARRPRKAVVVAPADRREDEATPAEARVVYSDDAEAAWLKKAGKFHYGYKCHAMVDARRGFFLGGHATGANRSDCKELKPLLATQTLDQEAFVFADKAYWSEENRACLKEFGLSNGLMKRAFRNRPLSEDDLTVNRLISSVRHGVERAFGTWKKDLGLARARYLGIRKLEYELMMTGLAFNIKKAVRLCF